MKATRCRFPVGGLRQDSGLNMNRPNDPSDSGAVGRSVRVASYNVEFSRSATPEQIGEMFIPYNLDIIGSDECPDGHAHALAPAVLPEGAAERFIVVGDFNNELDDDAITTLESAGMRPSWRDLDIDVMGAFTWNVLDPRRNWGVIDHIMYNNASGTQHRLEAYWWTPHEIFFVVRPTLSTELSFTNVVISTTAPARFRSILWRHAKVW